MKRVTIAVLALVPMLFTAACGTSTLVVGDLGARVSVSPSPISLVSPSPIFVVSPSPTSGPASACHNTRPQGNSVVMVDWVDFVQLGGTQFIAGLDGPVTTIASAQLGAVVGRVRCQLSALKFSEQSGPNVDGDAAFLAIGTEVHAIHGFEPSCRVAARIEGTNRVYLAHHDVGGYSRAVPCAKAP